MQDSILKSFSQNRKAAWAAGVYEWHLLLPLEGMMSPSFIAAQASLHVYLHLAFSRVLKLGQNFSEKPKEIKVLLNMST